MGKIKDNLLNVYVREPRTLDDLAHCVIAVINSQTNRDSWSRKKKVTEDRPHRVLGFAWDIRWSPSVSNSHSSPEGYPQNWGRNKPGVPEGYPGYQGRVWIRYADEPRSWGSSPFEATLTHTGTGGSGSYRGPFEAVASARYHRYGHQRIKGAYPEINCYSWDYRIFDYDFPGIVEAREKHEVWDRLANTNPSCGHTFEWHDTDTQIADAEFLAESATIRALQKANT